ncbi:MFS general substrate transporter [Rhizodiscina lignyota]|uniref:MFS general substrate transporter n=1 Tax=Rhizodiscina lignyota TaxID=1504668 RepID=A0A9P4I8W3_9PEZI|nr:MFS general substrate transporter [Rhizodiscina lignyota]
MSLSSDSIDDGQRFSGRKTPRVKVCALIAVIACQTMALRVMTLPLSRVIESRYCREYYREHDPSVISHDGTVPEELCKLNSVQQQLAWLQGSIETLHVLCDILVTLPLALLSDRRGRRPVLLLSTISMFLMWTAIALVGFFRDVFPVSVMLAATLFTLIGGGDCVFISTATATATDLAADEVTRATLFAYTGSVQYVSTLVAPALAAYTMTLNLWLPFVIGLGLLLLAMPLTLLLPGREYSSEESSTHTSRNVDEQSALLADPSYLEEEFSPENPSPTAKEDNRIRPAFFEEIFKHLSSLCTSIFERRKFQLLMGIFFLASLASSNTPILVLYISKRYGWTFAQAGYLLSAKAAVNVILLTVIIPGFVNLASRKFHLSTRSINVGAAEICIVISIAGVLCIAGAINMATLITGLVIYALGSALPIFTNLLVKDPQMITIHSTGSAQDYSLAVLSRTFGMLLGVPAMTAIWTKAISVGGAALGLPYFASAVSPGTSLLGCATDVNKIIYTIAAILVWRLRGE